MRQYFGEKKENNIIYLFSEDYNHIKNVLRMRSEEEVFVIFDKTKYLCKLNNDLKSVSILDEIEKLEIKNEIIFYIPITTEDKMDLVLQKGTELGVTKFVPTMYEYSKFKIDENKKNKKIERWKKIVKNASEQCQRIDIPVVEDIINTKNIEKCNGVNILCSLDKVNVKHISDVLTKENVYDTISVLYGPEGGISKMEEDFFESIGYIKTSLGSTILRTETVIIFVSSIIEYLKSGD